MKHAILLLMHENVLLVNKLLQLYPCEVDIFIHIDASSDIKITEIQQLSNIKSIIKRIECEWGKMSLVEATLELIKEAGNDYMYYHLVSGTCIPLCSIKDLNRLTYPNCYITKGIFSECSYGQLWFGSLWWSLPNIIINYINSNPAEIVLLKLNISKDMVPDEVFFNTIVANHFDDLIVNDNKRFIEMLGFHARTITKSDNLEGYLFARKVNLDYFKNE